jgi:outer membrane protein assembly factor BamB
MSASGRGVGARSIRVTAVLAVVPLAACGGSNDAVQTSATTLDEVAATTTSATPPSIPSSEPQASLPDDGDAGVALAAVDPGDGTVRWAVGDATFVSVPAVLALSDVVVGFGSDCRGNNIEAAWDRVTGAELWRTDAWNPMVSGVPNDAYVRSIQLGEIDGTVALARSDAVLGVEPSTGTLRWTFPSDGGFVIGVSAAADVFVVATLDGSGDVTYQGLDAETGESRWSTSLDHGRFDGAFAAGDHIVVIPGYDSAGAVMLALDADDGTIRWETPAAAGSDRSLPAVVASDVVVAVSDVGSVVIGLDPATGGRLWELPHGYRLHGQYSFSLESGALLQAPAVHVESSDDVALIDSQQGGFVWTTTWDEQNAEFSSGFIGTTVDGDALFGRPSGVEDSQGSLTLLGVYGETIWETDIFDVPANPADVIADRTDVYVLSHCGGS